MRWPSRFPNCADANSGVFQRLGSDEEAALAAGKFSMPGRVLKGCRYLSAACSFTFKKLPKFSRARGRNSRIVLKLWYHAVASLHKFNLTIGIDHFIKLTVSSLLTTPLPPFFSPFSLFLRDVYVRASCEKHLLISCSMQEDLKLCNRKDARLTLMRVN